MKYRRKSNRIQYPALNLDEEERIKVLNIIKSYGGLDGCWNWLRATSHGYGIVCFKTRAVQAHRAVFSALNGLGEGTVVMHTCDNRSCINPSHLVGGTQKDNIQDCLRKVRSWNQNNEKLASDIGRECASRRIYVRKPKPVRGPRFHVLSDQQIARIRELRPSMSLKVLSKMFGTCVSNVSQICSGHTRVKPI